MSAMVHHEIITDKKTIGLPTSFCFVFVIGFKSLVVVMKILL